jgi:hypothetical protein
MQNRVITLILSSVLVLSLGMISDASGQAFNPRDLAGIWEIGGANAFAGWGPMTRPQMTPRAIEVMKTRVPSPGAARWHIDNPQVTSPIDSNDLEYTCNPAGFPKLLLDAEPVEFIMLPDRMMMVFQWEHRIRYIWLDGRQVPSGENLDNLGPAWYGHSVGRWEGDTLVVTTVGLEERAWLDRPGHPVSLQTRIEERYRRVEADRIELTMTLTDPTLYAGPWPAAPRRFDRVPAQDYTYFGWSGLMSGISEGICAPMNEVEGYNKAFRDFSAGVPE